MVDVRFRRLQRTLTIQVDQATADQAAVAGVLVEILYGTIPRMVMVTKAVLENCVFYPVFLRITTMCIGQAVAAAVVQTVKIRVVGVTEASEAAEVLGQELVQRLPEAAILGMALPVQTAQPVKVEMVHQTQVVVVVVVAL